MGSDADVARQTALFHFVERVHNPFFLDDRQVFGTPEAVDVEQIHLVTARGFTPMPPEEMKEFSQRMAARYKLALDRKFARHIDA